MEVRGDVPGALVGRRDDLQTLAEAIPSHPLLTIVGPGGVGKTRLAEAVVEQIAGQFRDGVVTVRLAGLRDGTLVVDEVATAVGVPRAGGAPLRALTDWMAGRATLLVLDNAEHLIEDVAALVVALVRDAETSRVLVTSREPLLVPGETVVSLTPLPVPEDDTPPDELDRNPAVRLFLERATARDRAFSVTDPAALVRLCRRLDGLPLALELAAARAAVLGLDAVADAAVMGNQRGVDERHTNLRAVFDWSHGLLDEDERTLLRRLSVFGGGFTADALRAITDDGPLELLARLVEKSLVLRHGSRFRLLETVRQFATQHLVAAGEADRVRVEHARHFLDLGARVGAGVTSGPERAWLELLEPDVENLRIGLRTALDGVGGLDPVEALAVAAGLPMFWWTSGRHQEGIRWLQEALGACPDAPAELRAAALFGVGFLWAHDTDDWPAATVHLDAARDLLAEADTSPVLGYVLCLRGEAHAWAGEHDEALALTTRGEAILRAVPDPWGQAFAVWNVGFAHQRAGRWDAARRCYEQMADLQLEHGSRLELMIAWNSLAEVAELTGDHQGARTLYERGLDMRHELGARRLGFVHGSLPRSLLAVARCATATGDRDGALGTATEAHRLARAMDDAATAAAAGALLEQLAPAAVDAELTRAGDGWRLRFAGESGTLADVKGLHHLRRLIEHPGRPLAAATLVELQSGVPTTGGDAGPLLDAQALSAYRRRLDELTDEQDLADRLGDPDRSRRADEERAALVAELARATGLGGRARRAGSTTERARVNVTRTLRDAIERIRHQCPTAAEHLDRAVTTGFTCVYEPDVAVAWRL